MVKYCIECGSEVAQLYVDFGKGNIQLLKCRCGAFADKYLEDDLVTVFIDMVLQKRPVYIHMMYNHFEYNSKGINTGIYRFAILMVLFEVYMKWFKLERLNLLTTVYIPIHVQYLYMLALVSSETVMFHYFIRTLSRFLVSGNHSPSGGFKSRNLISMAIILSSFGRILLLAMVVWDYGNLDPTSVIELFVFMSNTCAISGN